MDTLLSTVRQQPPADPSISNTSSKTLRNPYKPLEPTTMRAALDLDPPSHPLYVSSITAHSPNLNDHRTIEFVQYILDEFEKAKAAGLHLLNSNELEGQDTPLRDQRQNYVK